MKNKILLSFCFFLFTNFSIFAQQADIKTAKKISKNYWYEKVNSQKKTSYSSVNVKHVYTEQSKSSASYYIFNIEGRKGFIIVSAEKSVNPVLGYSFESDYNVNEEKPPAFTARMNHYTEQIQYAKSLKASPRKEIANLWKKYSKKPLLNSKSGSKGVYPLLTTRWNQGKYYNDSCPADPAGNGGHVWVGCVAVAMAQVIKYWNYPEKGSGNKTYNHSKYGEQFADFKNTDYKWANMPNSLGSSTSSADVAATAQFLYHCGVGVSMNYGTSGSGAYSSSALNAMKKYFDYTDEAKYCRRYRYTDSAWNALLQEEIDAGRPLYYSGGSHAFNCDGYNDSNEFHFNWGWGGSYNGYFLTDDLTPGSYNFNSGQVIFSNLYPNCNNPTCSGLSTITEASGTITDGSAEAWINDNYSNCADCKWLIQPNNVDHINLSFINFSTIEGEDSLYVYDGPDDTYPVLLALSGDTIPDDVLSTGDEVFIHFITNDYTTAPGWKIEYTCSFNDAGVLKMLEPLDVTCGNTNDSIVVIVKNFGIDTQSSIPVTVDVNTPSGIQTFEKTLTKTLAMNEQDTIFVSVIDRTIPGNYSFTCYTKLANDTIINYNDTLYSEANVKIPFEIPFYDDISGDYYWLDRNRATYKNTGLDGNFYLSAYIGQFGSQFVILDNKIKNITIHSKLRFDYRIFDNTSFLWPPTDSLVLNEYQKIHIIASTDCGENFDTIHTIDNSNHIATSKFSQYEISLSDYDTEDLMIGYTTEWDTVVTIIDYDNILVYNELNGSFIINDQTVCVGDSADEIVGNIPSGGVGEIKYLWEKSTDGIVWDTAQDISNQRNYQSGILNYETYFRRIATDTINSTDTSNIVTVFVRDIPTVDLGSDILSCENEITLNDKSGTVYHKYLWSTGEEAQNISVNSSGTYWLKVSNTDLCSQTDTIIAVLNEAPKPDLGTDTVRCGGLLLKDLSGAIYNSYLWSSDDTNSDLYVSESGEYWLKVTDSNNCTGYDTVNVTINQSSLKPNLGEDITACDSAVLKDYSGINYYSYLWSANDTSITITVSESGEYVLEVIGSNKCSGKDTIDVIIYPVPEVSLGEDTEIFNNETLILKTDKDFEEYLWSDASTGDTLYINGADYTPDIYTFYINVKDNNNCSSSDTVNVTIKLFGTIYGDEINSIKVYPNPVNKLLNIEIEDLENVEVLITNSTGQILFSDKLNAETEEIDFSSYPVGMYYISFRTENKIKIFKIIKI